MVGQSQEFLERGNGAPGDHVESAVNFLGFGAFDGRIQSQLRNRGLKKLRAQLARFDEGDRPLDKAGDRYSRKACARSDIYP
jgi:hypothetical protein